MTDWLTQGLAVSGNLTVLEIAVSIILLSYLLEDLAIITAALLAADQSISPEIALIAIFYRYRNRRYGFVWCRCASRKMAGIEIPLIKKQGDAYRQITAQTPPSFKHCHYSLYPRTKNDRLYLKRSIWHQVSSLYGRGTVSHCHLDRIHLLLYLPTWFNQLAK